MRKKTFKKKIMIAVAAVAGLAIVLLSVFLFLEKKKLDETTAELNSKVSEINSNKQLVYVAQRDITKGEEISMENVMQQEIYTGLESSFYMQTAQLGGIATIDIKANEPVTESMVTEVEITKDLRWYEVAVANLMATQKNYDVVDVRILFPNGENYLVLTKKTITDLLMDTNIFTVQANEDEILRMSSAIVDAYTTTGTRIYTTKYIESNIQEEATPNYPVNPNVIDLINSDPNILDQAIETLNLKARNDLDRRLSNISEDQLSAVAAGLGLQDTASQSVIRDDDGNVILESDDESLLNNGTTSNTTDTQTGTSSDTETGSESESTDSFYSENNG